MMLKLSGKMREIKLVNGKAVCPLFKAGDIVRYADPLEGEESYRFRVLESHEDATPPRVHVEVLDSDWPIAPIEILAPDQLCAC